MEREPTVETHGFELDRKHWLEGKLTSKDGITRIYVTPRAGYTAHDGGISETGDWYYVATMFTNHCEDTEKAMNNLGALLETSKKPFRRDTVVSVLRDIMRLDLSGITWEYFDSDGVEDNMFWIPDKQPTATLTETAVA